MAGGDFKELFNKAVLENFGVHENIEIIEKRVVHLRTGTAITYEDLEKIADDSLWPFSSFWAWPSSEKIEGKLEETGQLLSKLKEDLEVNEKNILFKLNKIFKNISLVSILLRFVFPEYYGIYSPPVLHISGADRGKDEVEDYMNYLDVLRRILGIYEIRERYKVIRVADVDMLLLSISKLGGNYLKEFNALFTKSYQPAQTYLIEISDEFCKSMIKSDKTTKGRVLEALIRLSKEPCVGIGDTLRPIQH